MSTKNYYIRYELMGGEGFYMIYAKVLFGLIHVFFERWNTPESALIRLGKLNG